MIAINNEKILAKGCLSGNKSNLFPKVKFKITNENIEFEDETKYPEGDSRKSIVIKVFDANGTQVSGHISNSTTKATVDVKTLDMSEPIDILLYVVTKNRLNATVGAYQLSLPRDNGYIKGKEPSKKEDPKPQPNPPAPNPPAPKPDEKPKPAQKKEENNK